MNIEKIQAHSSELIAQIGIWLDSTILASGFSAAILTAASGAFFGALGAQRIAVRQERRRSKELELAATNLATGWAFSIFNSFCSFKKQNLKPLVDKYQEDRSRIFSEYGIPTRRKEFVFDFDFQYLFLPRAPIDELIQSMNKMAGTNPVNILNVTDLINSIDQLRALMMQRNEFIDTVRASKKEGFAPNQNGQRELMDQYFEVPGKHSSDQLMVSIIDGSNETIDYILAFSYILTITLSQEAFRKRANLSGRFSRGSLGAVHVDFTKAREDRLLPDLSMYEDRIPKPDQGTTGKPVWRSWSAHEKIIFGDPWKL